jgi:hypothetical protein
MQPPQQLVQWLRQTYPKPSVDEVRKSPYHLMAWHLTSSSPELAFPMLRVGGRGAQL